MLRLDNSEICMYECVCMRVCLFVWCSEFVTKDTHLSVAKATLCLDHGDHFHLPEINLQIFACFLGDRFLGTPGSAIDLCSYPEDKKR